jgi:hypothetical protein
MVRPGFEAIYTGQAEVDITDTPDADLTYRTDSDGYVIQQYSLWGFAHTKEADWNDEIRYINGMQAGLGALDEESRAIRAHIASLVCCDNGVPVTVDEMLNAIGTGCLPRPAFHPGCWLSRGTRTTQPHQTASMRAIEAVLRGYMAGEPKETFLASYPYAQGFIERTYAWLGPVAALTDVQRLMLERLLLPFVFFAKHSEDRQEVYQACFQEAVSKRAERAKK